MFIIQVSLLNTDPRLEGFLSELKEEIRTSFRLCGNVEIIEEKTTSKNNPTLSLFFLTPFYENKITLCPFHTICNTNCPLKEKDENKIDSPFCSLERLSIRKNDAILMLLIGNPWNNQEFSHLLKKLKEKARYKGIEIQTLSEVELEEITINDIDILCKKVLFFLSDFILKHVLIKGQENLFNFYGREKEIQHLKKVMEKPTYWINLSGTEGIGKKTFIKWIVLLEKLRGRRIATLVSTIHNKQVNREKEERKQNILTTTLTNKITFFDIVRAVARVTSRKLVYDEILNRNKKELPLILQTIIENYKTVLYIERIDEVDARVRDFLKTLPYIITSSENFCLEEKKLETENVLKLEGLTRETLSEYLSYLKKENKEGKYKPLLNKDIESKITELSRGNLLVVKLLFINSDKLDLENLKKIERNLRHSKEGDFLNRFYDHFFSHLLSLKEKEILKTLSLINPEIKYNVNEKIITEQFSSLYNLKETETSLLLEGLVEKGLLLREDLEKQRSDIRFTHPSIQLYFYSQVFQDEKRVNIFLSRIKDYYVHIIKWLSSIKGNPSQEFIKDKDDIDEVLQTMELEREYFQLYLSHKDKENFEKRVISFLNKKWDIKESELGLQTIESWEKIAYLILSQDELKEEIKIKVYLLLTQVYTINKLYNRAESYALKTLDLLKDMKRKDQYQKEQDFTTLHLLGIITQNTGDLRRAKGYFEEALMILENMEDGRGLKDDEFLFLVSDCYSFLATLYEKEEQLAKADEFYEEAIKTLEALSSEGNIIKKKLERLKKVQNLARFYMNVRDNGAAYTLLDDILKVLNKWAYEKNDEYSLIYLRDVCMLSDIIKKVDLILAENKLEEGYPIIKKLIARYTRKYKDIFYDFEYKSSEYYCILEETHLIQDCLNAMREIKRTIDGSLIENLERKELDVRIWLSKRYLEDEDFKQAAYYIEGVFPLYIDAVKLNPTKNIVDLGRILGDLKEYYLKKKETKKIKKLYDMTSELLKTLNQETFSYKISKINLWLKYGEYYKELNDVNKAEKYFTEGLEELKSINQTSDERVYKLKVSLLIHLSEIYESHKNFEKANEYRYLAWRVGYKLIREINRYAYLALFIDLTDNLVNESITLPQIHKIISYVEETMELWKKIIEEDPLRYSMPLLNLFISYAKILFLRGEFDEAEVLLLKAQKVQEQFKNTPETIERGTYATILKDLAEIYRKKNDKEKAEKNLLEARDIFKSMKNLIKRAPFFGFLQTFLVEFIETLRCLGGLYQEMGRSEEAQRYHKEANALTQQVKNERIL